MSMAGGLVIVGNGAAGFSTLQAFRGLDRSSRVTVVSEERGPTYLRVLLPPWLAGHVPDEALLWAQDDDYERLGARRIEGARVVFLEPDSRMLYLEDEEGRGGALPYDVLVAASGATPWVPPGVPQRMPGVWVVRTWEDAVGLREAVAAGDRVLIVGAGPLGIKTALALADRGARVGLVEKMPHVLPAQADHEAAALVEAELRRLGVSCTCGRDVAGVEVSEGRIAGLLLSGAPPRGSATDPRSADAPARLECRHVVFCTGVTPCTAWLAGRAQTASSGGGLLVDDTMATSLPGVFAAGDVAAAPSVIDGQCRTIAIWPQAVAMGRVAGQNAALCLQAGGSWAPLAVHTAPVAARPYRFAGGLPRNALDIGGLAFCSFGTTTLHSSDGLRADVAAGPGWYRKIVYRHGRPVGAVLVGNVDDAGRLQAALRRAAQEGVTSRAVGGGGR